MSLQPEEQDSQKMEQLIDIPDWERERIKKNINRSDMEKFQLFTQMLRRGIMLKRAKITHK